MFESLIPRATLERPEKTASIALFLASGKSSFVDGVNLCADGGYSSI